MGWLKKTKRTTQLFTVSVLTDIGFSLRLSVHAFLVCRGFSHEHPQIGLGELEKHCWVAKSPPAVNTSGFLSQYPQYYFKLTF